MILYLLISRICSTIDIESIISSNKLPLSLDKSLVSSKNLDENFKKLDTMVSSGIVYKCEDCNKYICNSGDINTINQFLVVVIKNDLTEKEDEKYFHITCFISHLKKNQESRKLTEVENLHIFGLIMLYLCQNQDAINVFEDTNVIDAYNSIENILIEIAFSNIMKNELSRLRSLRIFISTYVDNISHNFNFLNNLRNYVITLPSAMEYVNGGFLNDTELFYFIKYRQYKEIEFEHYISIISRHSIDNLRDSDLYGLIHVMLKKSHINDFMLRRLYDIFSYAVHTRSIQFKNDICYLLIINYIKNKQFGVILDKLLISVICSVEFSSDRIVCIWMACIETCNSVEIYSQCESIIVQVFRLFYGMDSKSSGIIKNHIYESIRIARANSDYFDNIYYSVNLNINDYNIFKNIENDDIIETYTGLHCESSRLEFNIIIYNKLIIEVLSNLESKIFFNISFLHDFLSLENHNTIEYLCQRHNLTSFYNENFLKMIFGIIDGYYSQLGHGNTFIDCFRAYNTFFDINTKLNCSYKILCHILAHNPGGRSFITWILSTLAVNSDNIYFSYYFHSIVNLLCHHQLFIDLKQFLSWLKPSAFKYLMEIGKSRYCILLLISEGYSTAAFEIIFKLEKMMLACNSQQICFYKQFINICYQRSFKQHNLRIKYFNKLVSCAFQDQEYMDSEQVTYLTMIYKYFGLTPSEYLTILLNEIFFMKSGGNKLFVINQILVLLNDIGFFKGNYNDENTKILYGVLIRLKDFGISHNNLIDIFDDHRLKNYINESGSDIEC